MRRATATLAALLCVLALATQAGAAMRWRYRVETAARYAETRAGDVSFAVVGANGVLRGHRRGMAVPAASVLKVMFMVAYLRQSSVRDRPLRDDDRQLLAPMIKRSANDPATRIADMLGPGPMYRLARDAGMRHFSYTRPWGYSLTSARDQARFMFRLERYIPDRHEDYALYLLSHVIESQRWGMADFVDSALPGWKLWFKGGWGSGTGWVDHQVGFIESRGRRIAIAVMTYENPDHAYGIATQRGVARRLLGHLGD